MFFLVNLPKFLQIMRLAFSIIVFFNVLYSFSQVPSYYQNINLNNNGEVLKNELNVLLTNSHVNELVYTPEVWEVLKNADVSPTNSNKVMLLYGYNDTDVVADNDKTRDRYATCHSSNCAGKWVREHVFPRSKGTPNLEYEGPGADAHHLHAIDYDRNSSRSNFKFIANPTSYITYSRIVQQNGTEYFYPGDEWKGDVARMIMYMYVRYGNRCQPINVGAGSTSYSTNGDMPNVFLKWNEEDPVSVHEITRNEEIFKAQGNRNPFIDNPYLATKIWNGPMAENKWKHLNNDDHLFQNIKVYPTITNNFVTIESNEPDLQISLYDTSGKNIQVNLNNDKIDLTKYSTGLYVLKLTSKEASKSYKIIKK